MANPTLADLIRQRQDKLTKAQQAMSLLRLLSDDPELRSIVTEYLASPQSVVETAKPHNNGLQRVRLVEALGLSRSEQVVALFQEHGNKWMKISEVARALGVDRRVVGYVVYVSRKGKFEKRSLSGSRKGVQFRLLDDPKANE